MLTGIYSLSDKIILIIKHCSFFLAILAVWGELSEQKLIIDNKTHLDSAKLQQSTCNRGWEDDKESAPTPR